MKDFKSMIIGFLLATCMFLMIAPTKINTQTIHTQIGRYQGFADQNDIHLIDTTTGELWEYTSWSPKRWIYVTNQFAQE